MNGDVFRSLVTTVVAMAASLMLTTRAETQATAVTSSVATPETADGQPDLSGFWAPTRETRR